MSMENEVAKAMKIVNSRGEEITAKFKDREDLTLWKFGRHDKEITLVLEDGSNVEFPDYMEHSRSSFGFDRNNGILAKQCYKCKLWFVIAKLSSEGKWDRIPDKEVHFDNTKFRSYCNSCYNDIKLQKGADVTTQNTSSKSGIQGKFKKAPRPGTIKTTVNLTEDERRFLNILAAIDNVRVEYVLEKMIERERKERDYKL